MKVVSLFDNIDEADVNKMLKCFDAKKINYKKDRTILSNVSNNTKFGIILNGSANVIRVDYNGVRSIIERLDANSIFGGPLYNNFNNELSIVATSDSEVLEFDYSHIISRCKKNCECHTKLLDNMLQILANKVAINNEKILIMSKKSIREKLLEYFKTKAYNAGSKNFKMDFTLTDLADYLSIDRSAMMREIKNLKNDGFIEIINKRIYLYF